MKLMEGAKALAKVEVAPFTGAWIETALLSPL